MSNRYLITEFREGKKKNSSLLLADSFTFLDFKTIYSSYGFQTCSLEARAQFPAWVSALHMWFLRHPARWAFDLKIKP